MNIGFYGHSNCAYRSEHSFIDIVADYFNAAIVNLGVKQGSEERILFELKKTPQLDLAVIFHSSPRFLFIPDSDRDIDTRNFSISRAEELFRDDHLDIEFTKNKNPKFKNLFQDNDRLYNAVDTYRKYFYHQDLVINRYYGALTQIDQYLSYKNISAIHVIDNAEKLPAWFKFTSGNTDTEIMSICKTHESKNPFFVNCVSQEGNQLIAQRLIKIINDQNRSKD